MKILGTGLSGLVGSRVVELLSPSYSFDNLSKETGIDITHDDIVRRHIQKSQAPWVFHFAAKTNVDGAEKERALKEKSETWKINVTATENIVQACRQTGKKLLYISTDYVFDGTKDSYAEDDDPNPQGWYAITKYEGEKRVAQLEENGLIIRIANPYRANIAGKFDFVHKIMERLRQREPVQAPDDQIFVPTFIDDIARAIQELIKTHSRGMFHVVGSQPLTPLSAAKKIASVFGYDTSLITSLPFAKFTAGRAPRPFHAYLKNDKITQLGIRMRTFDEGLREVRKQVDL